MVLLVYNHNGYLLKLPFTLCDDGESRSGLVMTGLITLGLNALTFGAYSLMKKWKSKNVNRDQKTAFVKYQSNIERATAFIAESQLFIDRSLNLEIKNRGLVIIEAYFGLADHIY
jgi:hypothetical protein